MSKKTADFYDVFAFAYPLADFFLRPQKRILYQKINGLQPGKLLDIGVGNGSHLKNYATHDVVGIDTSKGMLAEAEKRKIRKVQLLQMNGESLQFPDNLFDYVVLSHVLAVADNPDKILSEANRVLKTGGLVIILNHFTPKNWMAYVDKFLRSLSQIFHFDSVFYIENLNTNGHLRLLEVVHFPPWSYFKLLIYQKL